MIEQYNSELIDKYNTIYKRGQKQNEKPKKKILFEVWVTKNENKLKE